MLRNIQPEVFQKKTREDLEDIKHNLRLLERISKELESFSTQDQAQDRNFALDKSQRLKFDIREKLISMGLNINEMISVLDYKIMVLCKQLSKMQKLQKANKNSSQKILQKKSSIKSEEQYKYQINQLEERIFQLQKKENQYVKEISELKERNSKLRDEFSSLSFDSNQRIKELSEKLHNNTSPNLTIKRLNPNTNPQTNNLMGAQQSQKKNLKNNFVKIKGAKNFQRQVHPFQMSPSKEQKNNKNLLDSMTSQSSQYDIKAMGYDLPQFEQNSANLKFGCFPGKKSSQKTKTGSSSENKKMNLEERCDKSRRFEFLLNNLIDKPDQQQDNFPHQNSGGYKAMGSYQPANEYQYKPLGRIFKGEQCKSVFNENVIKRYQI